MAVSTEDIVKALKPFKDQYEAEGRPFDVFGLEPYVPENKNSDFMLIIHGNWMNPNSLIELSQIGELI